jgi:hypothetical protein
MNDEDFSGIEAKALASGAKKSYVLDLQVSGSPPKLFATPPLHPAMNFMLPSCASAGHRADFDTMPPFIRFAGGLCQELRVPVRTPADPR